MYVKGMNYSPSNTQADPEFEALIGNPELVLLVLIALELAKFVLHILGVYKESSNSKASRLELLEWYVCMIALALVALVTTRYPFPLTVHAIVLSVMVQTGLTYYFAQVLVRRCRDSGWPKATAYFAAAPYIGGIVALLLLFWSPTQEPTKKS